MADIYGQVSSPTSITGINRAIRGEIGRAKSRARLSELVRRSRYLVTLSYAPAWKKKFAGQVRAIRNRARSEYCKTATRANKRALQVKGAEPIYATNVKHCPR